MVLNTAEILKVTREQASGFGNAEIRQPAKEMFPSWGGGRTQPGKGSGGRKKALSRGLTMEETSLISQCNSFTS